MRNFFKKLMKKPSINPEDYGIDLGQFPIAEAESKVYRGQRNGESYVLKVYGNNIEGTNLTLSELAFYQEVTSEVKRRFDGHPLPLIFRSEATNYQLRIVLIDEIGVLPVPYNKVVCSVSEFIPGETLIDVMSEEEWQDSKAILSELSSEINLFLGNGHDLFIHPWNIKPRLSSSEFMITDVYGQISKLQGVCKK